MLYTIKSPLHIDATIDLPASKSISNRALIICKIANAGITPMNISHCDDTDVMVRALESPSATVDIHGAGTAMRFLTAYLAATDSGTRMLTGSERMLHRPIGLLVNALRQLGANIEYAGEEGYPPLRITGTRLEGGYIEMPGDVSSQFVTALLLIGPALQRGLMIKLTGDIISRPYIDLTIHIMHDFGARVEWTDIDTIEVEPVPYTVKPYSVENDWSAASYWYEIMALSGGEGDVVRLKGLRDGSRQGDSVVRYIFSLLGVRTSFKVNAADGTSEVTLRKIPTRLKRLEYDFKNQPDMAQTFVVSCALLNIPFRFTGLSTLRIKETDRIEAVRREMRKIGYMVHDGGGDELAWDGDRCTPDDDPIVIDTYDDHRMAMAFAPLALRMPQIGIRNPAVVSKSYPGYWDDLRLAGFTVSEE